MSRNEEFHSSANTPGIRVTEVNSRPHKRSGIVIHTGTVADGQVGYRGIQYEELFNPVVDDGGRSLPEGQAYGYRSRGTFNTKVERGSRGSTMFSSEPLTPEEMTRHGYTHQIEADLSGLRFRTLRAPQGDRVNADIGLGLGIKGEMDYSRIKSVKDARGVPVKTAGTGHPGQDIKQDIYADTARLPRGK